MSQGRLDGRDRQYLRREIVKNFEQYRIQFCECATAPKIIQIVTLKKKIYGLAASSEMYEWQKESDAIYGSGWCKAK